MRTFIRCATLALALVASIPVTNAQPPVTQQPYEAFIVQPSGTLVAQMPFVAIPEGVIRPPQVQSLQPEHLAQPIAGRQVVASHHVIDHHVAAVASEHVPQSIARYGIVASHHVIRHVATVASSRPLYNYIALVPVRRIVTPVVVAPAPAPTPGPVLNVSGQFQCVQGCAGGLPGTAFVTQNGWDLNLVNELGQPSRAWIDRPGHIWAQNWIEGAVYSSDGMTIQFDNGTVWRRNIELWVLRPNPGGR